MVSGMRTKGFCCRGFVYGFIFGIFQEIVKLKTEYTGHLKVKLPFFSLPSCLGFGGFPNNGQFQGLGYNENYSLFFISRYFQLSFQHKHLPFNLQCFFPPVSLLIHLQVMYLTNPKQLDRALRANLLAIMVICISNHAWLNCCWELPSRMCTIISQFGCQQSSASPVILICHVSDHYAKLNQPIVLASYLIYSHGALQECKYFLSQYSTFSFTH